MRNEINMRDKIKNIVDKILKPYELEKAYNLS